MLLYDNSPMAVNYDIKDHVDVSKQFDRKKVRLRSDITHCFASARFDLKNNPLCCNIGVPDTWETFLCIIDEDGWLTIQSHFGQFLSVRLDYGTESPPVCATANNPDTWEKFKIYKSNGKYYIKSKSNGKWLSCRADYESKIILASIDKDNLNSWEEFDIWIA